MICAAGRAERDRRARQRDGVGDGRCVEVPIGYQQFREGIGHQRVGERLGSKRRDIKSSRRDITHGDRGFGAATTERNGGKRLVLPGRQQCVFGQRAGRYDTDNVAIYDGFRATFLCFGRGFRLLANGNPASGFDQSRQISLGGMIGYARHWDGLAFILPSRG